MKNSTIFFTAIIVLLLGFLLCGCVSVQKAIRTLEKKDKLAEVCADHYPVVDSAGKTTIVYRPANNVDHTKQLDSLKKDFDEQLHAFKDAQRIQANDTGCARTIQALQKQYEVLVKSYEQLYASYKPCKPDTAYRDRDIYHDTNPAKTAALQSALDKQSTELKQAENGRANWRKWALITWGIIAACESVFFMAKTKII